MDNEDPNKQSLDPDSVKWRNSKAAFHLACNRLRGKDAVALVSFSNLLKVEQNFTTNKKIIDDVAATLKLNAGTRLLDALWIGDTITRRQSGKRMLFLITDGQDNGSVKDQQTVIAALKQDSISVFAVGLGVSGAGATALLQICVGTGGKCFLIPTTAELPAIIDEVFQNIYFPDCTLSYTTNDTCKSGATKSIDLSVSAGGNTGAATVQYTAPDLRSRMSLMLATPQSMKALEQREIPLVIEGELRGGEATSASLQISYDPTLLAFRQFRTNASLFAPDFTATENAPGSILVQSNASQALKGIPYGSTDTLGWLTFGALQLAHSSTTELIIHDISIAQNCDAVATGLQSTITIQSLDGVRPPAGSVGSSFGLQQNHPNPIMSLNGSGTVIEFTLIEKGWTTLDVYDFCGRRVARLIDADLPPGSHSVSFAPAQLPKGVYSYVLREGTNIEMKKMVWLR